MDRFRIPPDSSCPCGSGLAFRICCLRRWGSSRPRRPGPKRVHRPQPGRRGGAPTPSQVASGGWFTLCLVSDLEVEVARLGSDSTPDSMKRLQSIFRDESQPETIRLIAAHSLEMRNALQDEPSPRVRTDRPLPFAEVPCHWLRFSPVIPEKLEASYQEAAGLFREQRFEEAVISESIAYAKVIPEAVKVLDSVWP